MIEKIVVPDIGENVESGKVVAVHIKAGDSLEVDDTVVELETDKAVVEIPSPFKGKVTEVLAREGDEMKVGDLIAKIETEGRNRAASDTASEEKVPDQKEPPAPEKVEPRASADDQPKKEDGKSEPETAPVRPADQEISETPMRPVPASPSIRRLARELGVEIQRLQGSGPGGRITEADIKAHVREERRAVGSGAPSAMAGGQPRLPDFSRWGEAEAVELETVRRLTAESTATSWLTIPHVTQFDKADITALDAFLKKNAKKATEKGGKLTLTPLLTYVCARALNKFPRFNASLDLANQRLIFKKYVHIGIAVDTPRGLLMPVVRQADRKSILELAAEIADLAERARNKKIKSAELEGGTFSISNQGGIGGVAFTPIVLWPQVAILGMSRASMEPVYVDGQFQPRSMLPLSLSYDHRVIDGADAARFLRWICDCLEQPMTMHL